MISRTAEYAFLALGFLAGTPDKAVTTREIAEATGLPGDYLSKILRALRRHGILLAHRGIGGGFSFARAPSEVSVLDVLTALGENLPTLDHCPLGLAIHLDICPIHHAVNDAVALLRARFAGMTIEELAVSPEERLAMSIRSETGGVQVTLGRK